MKSACALGWLGLGLAGIALGATPTFVQEVDNQIGAGQTNAVTFSTPTAAGNLIAVYLIWDSTGNAAVSDSLGNLYTSAGPPIRWSNGLYSAQIFYAIDSRGGVNTLTATFSNPVTLFGIAYAHEYSGISLTSPIDVTASAVGTSGSLDSGAATTANPVDLIFAGGVSENNVLDPGAGYTARSTAHGNMTEDKLVSSTGSYNATATNSGGAWGMQMVAFRGASSGGTSDTTPPSVPTGLTASAVSSSQINLSWFASTDPDNSPSQLAYAVYRNGSSIATAPVGTTSWTDAGLAGSTTYSYSVAALDPVGNSSAQSSAAQATTLAASDTTPPTVPTNLFVTGTTTSSVSLSWAGSTDNVGVAGYKIYRSGVQIGVSGIPSYTDAGLAASTTYSYSVAAYDAAGNNSAQTGPVSGTTNAQANQDTQPPTVSITSPGNNQTVSGITTIAANAADNVGVTALQFQLDGANFGAQLTNPPYSTGWNTAQTANGSHVLSAIAFDAAGNRGVSTSVTITVSNSSSGRTYSTNFPAYENPISEGGRWTNGGQFPAFDWTNMQTTPGLAFGTMLPFSGDDNDSIALLTGAWGPNQTVTATLHADGDFANGLEAEILLRGTFADHSATGYEITFAAGYIVIARWDGDLNNVTTLASNTSPDWDLSDATITGTISGNTITASVNGVQEVTASDDTYSSGSPGMGAFISEGGDPASSDLGFTSFSATDGGGSGSSDTNPPSTPSNLSAAPVSVTEIDLIWNASVDDVGVAAYLVFRNNSQIATTNRTSFADTAAVPGVQYAYAVAAMDAAGNVSSRSVQVFAATSSAPDTTPPSIPTGLQSSNIASTSVTISWSPSTDNVGVAGYRVYRGGVQVATTTATSFNDTGLTAFTGYIYTVAAFDSSNNVSAQSNQLLVTMAGPTMMPPAFVQVSENQISTGSSTPVNFGIPTRAGNTIVVYVIWSNAGAAAVTDSAGNRFVSASGPLSWGAGYSAQIFYATGIVGGSDTVTAAFQTPVNSFGVAYVHEYSGIDPVRPVDVTAAASGSSASMSSGNATTTSANDLIFGAGVSDNNVSGTGSGFISRDLAFGNITEDRTASAIGSYAASATHNGQQWGMQMVAFRAAQ